LEAKRQGSELEFGPRIEPISTYIENEMARLESSKFHFKKQSTQDNQLDEFFRQTLKEVWVSISNF
jgi:hypothetical protein